MSVTVVGDYLAHAADELQKAEKCLPDDVDLGDAPGVIYAAGLLLTEARHMIEHMEKAQ